MRQINFANQIFLTLFLGMSFTAFSAEKDNSGNNNFVVSAKCTPRTIEPSLAVDSLQESSAKVARFTACKSVDNLGFDAESCNQYEACAKSILGIQDIKGFLADSNYFHNEVLPLFGGITGEHFTNQLLIKKLNDIEDKKNLRKFAEKLGINLPDKKSCEEKNSNGKCNREDFEKNFLNVQKNCKSDSGYNCYKLEDAAYTSIDLSTEKDIKADVYLDRVAEAKAVDAISNDKSTLEDLVVAIQNIKEPKAKKGSNLRTKKVKEFLANLDQQKKLDPFFQSIKSNDEEIADLVWSLGKITTNKKEDLLGQLQEYRKQKMVSMFSGDSCEKIMTIRSICETKNAIETNDKESITPMNAKFVKELAQSEDYDKEYEKLKSQKNSAFDSKEEYMAMIKGFQCYMLVYDFQSNSSITDFQCLKDPIITSKSQSAFSGGSSDRRKFSPDDNKEVIKAEGSKVTDNIDAKLNNNAPVAPSDAKVPETVKTADNVDLNKTLANTFGNNNANPNDTLTDTKKPIVNTFVPNSDSSKEELENAKEENDNSKNKNYVSTGTIEDQLKELNKKLANTEDTINKLKDKKGDASDDKASAEKDAQLKALEAQVKSLKSDIASAKQKAVSTEDKSDPTNHNGLNNVKMASIPKEDHSTNSNQNSNNNSIDNRNAENKENSRSIASVGGGTTSQVASASSGSAGGINGSIGSSVKSVGLVLTKVDGLTSEALAETINLKIAESKGQPFLIEEGGFVKEIIPVLKDGKVVLDEKGKPVFEKITKGKIADLKQKDSNRAPASISSQADLKKAEELRVKAEQDRLKYEALKKLSSEAVK